MKKTMLTQICLLAISTPLFAFEPSTPLSKSSHPNGINGGSYKSAVAVTEADMNDLTHAFESRPTEATWGGSFQKSDLQTLLNSAPAGVTFINFRFGMDPLGFTSLMLSAAKKVDQSEMACIRNGRSEAAFCPTACNTSDLTTAEAISISYQEYTELSEAYQTANPEKTRGGNIDKAALQELINSLPSDMNRICFRFCIDTQTGKTSVIFIGGQVGQRNNTTLMYRNGKDADAFCPTNCNRQ